MDQNPLFTEDLYTALDDVCRAYGGYKKIAGVLWPKVATGYNKLKNKLNADHHENFNPDELLHLLSIGRELGCHTALYFMCDETGYERPKPAAPKSKRAELLELDAKLADRRAQIARDLDRLEAAEVLRAVK